MGHEAIVNKQQNVACQHDLSVNPVQLANGMLWEPCPGLRGGLEINLSKWRKGGLFAHPVYFVFEPCL